MSVNVVETTGLTKHYGDVRAIQDLSLAIPKGTIFGLLGPNGAGKTTIIGTLLGLIRPTAGTFRLFGTEIDGSTDEAVRRIGAIMETPAFYPFMSGRDNLRYFQGISGTGGPEEIDRLLDLVGMSARAEARFNTYSLGMKHRLGIAYAMLGDPELLLLDEPTNGLDPNGMAEVRQLLKTLGDGNRTVVLASHLLNEVEQVCDHVAILSHGSVIAEGTVFELIGHRGRIHLSTTDNAAAHRLLSPLEWVGSVLVSDGGLVIDAPSDRVAEISEALAGVGVYPTELRSVSTSLEQFFLEVTEGDHP
jgi:ABC-2 type transport system ATP-binding protein